MYTKIILLVLFFTPYCSNALDVGNETPFLRKIRILSGKKTDFYFEKNKIPENRLYVIYFWSTWSNSSYHLVDFVDRLNKKYKKNNVVFIGVSKEKEKIVKRFLAKIPDIGLNVCVDPTVINYNKYMFDTKGTPLFFVVNSDRKLIWKGSPFELNRVISRVVMGGYNTEIQKKIEEYRKGMRHASELFNNNKMLNEANNILNLDPTDLTALNFVVDNLIKQKKFTEAIAKVKESQRDKKNKNIFFLKDSFYTELSIIRVMDSKDIKYSLSAMLNEFYSSFKNEPVYLVEMSNAVINEISYELLPLQILNIFVNTSIKQKSFSTLESKDKSLILQSAAKVYYFSGLINKSIKMQEYAFRFLKGEDKKQAEIYLNYYKEVREIGTTNCAN